MESQLLAVVKLETNDLPNYIYIYEDDDIELLVDAFCDLNQIKQIGKQFIIKEINNNLKKVKTFNKVEIIEEENQNQQSSEIQNKDQLNESDKVSKLPINISLSKESKTQTNFQLQDNQFIKNQIEEKFTRKKNIVTFENSAQQDGNQFIISNEKPRKRIVSQNQRYLQSSSSQQKQIVTKSLFQNFEKRFKQQIIQRKKIFDADQAKIKYQQNIDVIMIIFKELDSDEDGQISSELINLQISEQTLQLIAPVLFHMQEQGMILDFDSFAQLIKSFDILIY